MRLVRSLLLSLVALMALPAAAQDKLDADVDTEQQALALANTRWSMINPERDYEGGCMMGFFSFRFSPAGYFVFDNKLQGSWRVDSQGNIRLITRSGERFMLMLEDNQLKLLQNLRINSYTHWWVVKRNTRFQKCPNE